MASVREKVASAIQESRIFVLGVQVLVGFQLKAHFEDRYDALTAPARALQAAGLAFALAALVLVVLPTMFHRIACGGEDVRAVHRVASAALRLAPLPFVLALGANFFVAAERVQGRGGAVTLAVATLIAGLLLLEVVPLWARRRRQGRIEELRRMQGQEREEETPLKDQVNQVLMETRVVLPGALALLGFQFVVMLTAAFERLPASSRQLHLVAFGLVAVGMLLLMMPTTYHRICERGEDTEHFVHFASRMVVLAPLPTGLGMAIDCYVILQKASGSAALAAGGAALLLLAMFGAWYAFPLAGRGRAARRRRDKERQPLAT